MGLRVTGSTHLPPSDAAPRVHTPLRYAHSLSQSSSPHMPLQHTGGPWAAQPPADSFERGPMQQ